MAIVAGCARAPEPPRLLLLVGIDTLRADHVGALGYPKPTTPELDRLAARGALFERAVSTSSWTVPAVASVVSGLSPGRHGAGIPGAERNLDVTPPAQMRPEVRTLAQRLSGAGWATGLVSANPFLYGRFRDGFEQATVERVTGSEVVDRALAWLDRPESRPRFLYVHLMDVHAPNAAPERLRRLFPVDGEVPALADGSFRASWELAGPEPELRRARELRTAAYDAAIRYDDEQLGRLLDGVTRRGFGDRILVLVFADHGEELWDHAAIEHAWGDDPRGVAGIGHGHSLFEELLRVPLVVAGAGVTARRSQCPATLLDVAPTLLGAARLPADPDWEGVDLRTLERRPGDCPPRPLFASSPAYGPDSDAVRLGALKLYRRGAGIELLFDLRDDPGERNPLPSGAPGRERLRALVERHRAASLGEGPVEPIRDPELLESLRALGYL